VTTASVAAVNGAPPLALTMGDPAGIGLEITLKAWLARHDAELMPFCLYGGAAVLQARAAALQLNVPIAAVAHPRDAVAVFTEALPVFETGLQGPVLVGQPTAINAPAVLASIKRAVEDAAAGVVRGVVTNPIAKSVLYSAGFPHPGHTEYLAELSALLWPGKAHQPVMMLACDRLKAVPLTIHVPLKSVPGMITQDLIMTTARITADALRRDFGFVKPRIAVAGLNPHAGEAGSIGLEDRDIISPAIQELAQEGMHITGPHPADTLFHAAARASYDAAICMYHDQALIPVKTLAFDSGVNVTLGLPFVRTSPDHGTAFDIAAKGIASPQSLIEALKLADQMSRQRAKATA
jgi:4-hydroxythreonine-4-phosphate dehydrogenase